MSKSQPIFVIDTNVVVDYEDIIPSLHGPVAVLEEPTIDLSEAHLVIPSVVIRELSSFKGEKSERGKAARTVLKRIREISESDLKTMEEVYKLNATVKIGKQTISILPVDKDFHKHVPFQPSDGDMDGQIILTAMTAASLGHDVVLLTNDNGLAIRARERGVKTMRYGHKCPAPYTGRRDIVVPAELFQEFLHEKELPREVFEQYLPAEPRLIANEFVVMTVANPEEYPRDYDVDCDAYFERIGRYDAARDAICHLRYVSSFPVKARNPGQAIYAEALMDPEIAAVICSGPAGSGKTYMATIFGYTACLAGQFIGVTVVPCESKSKLGALPGDLDEKMDPDVQPLKNALRNYLLHEDSRLKKELENIQKFGPPTKGNKKAAKKHAAALPSDDEAELGLDDDARPQKRSIKVKLKDRVENIWDNWFSSVPIEIARGRDFAYELAIYDEFQDQNATQADTLLKRLGAEGKIVLTGDIQQIHAVYLDQFNNGLVYASRLLFDNPMVAQVCFTEDEIVRHPLVQLIAKRQKAETAPAETES